MSQEWKTYACRYYHNGKWWALDLVAHDDDDAESRARKLGNLQLLGQIKAQIPARVPFSGTIAKTLVVIRNLMGQRK